MVMQLIFIQVDSSTLSFYEANPTDYPMFDTSRILRDLLGIITASHINVRSEMLKYDRRKAGSLSKVFFVIGLLQTYFNQVYMLNYYERNCS